MKRISTLALLAFLALTTPSHAGEARLWACHGPAGAPLGSTAFFRAQVFDVAFSGGCDLPDSALTGSFTRADPTGASEARLIAAVPPGVTLKSVTLDRTARGPGYSATAPASGAFESENAGTVLEGVTTAAASGGSVAFGVRCEAAITARCDGLAAAGFSLRSLALTVQDATGPTFAVGGIRSPATGLLDLDVRAFDNGIGLRSAAASLDGTPLSQASFGGCPELSPADGTADIALGVDCTVVGNTALSVDTAAVADGVHTLAVTVTDIAGNATSQATEVEVANHLAIPVGTPVPTATPTTSVAATATPLASSTPPAAPTAEPTATPITLPAAVVTVTPTPTPTPLARPTTAALVRLPQRVSRKGVYSVSVLCPAASLLPCAHRLTLKAQGKTIATGKGSSKPGRRAQIALELTSAARRTLARKGALTATLTLSGAAPTTVRLRG